MLGEWTEKKEKGKKPLTNVFYMFFSFERVYEELAGIHKVKKIGN